MFTGLILTSLLLILGYRIDAEVSSLKKKLDEKTASQKSSEVQVKDLEETASETIEVSFNFDSNCNEQNTGTIIDTVHVW